MSRVVVTGVGGPAGRAVAEELYRRGHRVLGVDMNPVVLPGIETTFVPAAADPRFACVLHDLAVGAGADLVVPTVSEELLVLAEAPGVVRTVVAGEAGVRLAADKWLTARTLRRAGVAVPHTVLGGTDTTWRRLVEELGAPVVSKPRRGRGGRGVVVHHSGPPDLGDSSVLQEFAPGTEYCPAVYRHSDGTPPVVVVLEKTALAHGNVGNGTAVRRVAAPDVAAVALAAVAALDLTGPVDVDVRRRADGTPLVLEVNARVGAHAASVPELFDALLAEHLHPARATR